MSVARASTAPASRAVNPSYRALCAAGLAAALVTLVGLLALGGSAVPRADEQVLHAFSRLDTPGADRWLRLVAHLADRIPYLLASGALIVVSWRSGKHRLAQLLPLMLAGSAVTTQVLKQLLAEPRFVAWLGSNQVDNESWPSGHATAAMTLALAVMLVVPPERRRRVALLAGAYVIAVCTAVLAMVWHFPSDVIGGLCVAAVWGLLTLAALTRQRRIVPTPALRATVTTD